MRLTTRSITALDEKCKDHSFGTEADGETADESRQQWWCITKGGETVNTSADQTPIHDNDQFEITLKEGY